MPQAAGGTIAEEAAAPARHTLPRTAPRSLSHSARMSGKLASLFRAVTFRRKPAAHNPRTAAERQAAAAAAAQGGFAPQTPRAQPDSARHDTSERSSDFSALAGGLSMPLGAAHDSGMLCRSPQAPGGRVAQACCFAGGAPSPPDMHAQRSAASDTRRLLHPHDSGSCAGERAYGSGARDASQRAAAAAPLLHAERGLREAERAASARAASRSRSGSGVHAHGAARRALQPVQEGTGARRAPLWGWGGPHRPQVAPGGRPANSHAA